MRPGGGWLWFWTFSLALSFPRQQKRGVVAAQGNTVRQLRQRHGHDRSPTSHQLQDSKKKKSMDLYRRTKKTSPFQLIPWTSGVFDLSEWTLLTCEMYVTEWSWADKRQTRELRTGCLKPMHHQRWKYLGFFSPLKSREEKVIKSTMGLSKVIPTENHSVPFHIPLLQYQKRVICFFPGAHG